MLDDNYEIPREFEMAEYYYRNSNYRASRYYYQRLMQKYPETQFVQTAQQRMNETQSLPGVPAPKFTWLDYVFPTANKDGPKPIAMPSHSERFRR